MIELCFGGLIGSVIGAYQAATLRPVFDKVKDFTTLKCLEAKDKVQKYRESKQNEGKP